MISKRYHVIGEGGDTHRREAPKELGAITVLGYSWADTVRVMYEDFLKSAPELKKRNILWRITARINGFRIEFFEDDEAFLKDLQKRGNDFNGPQVHIGRITWL